MNNFAFELLLLFLNHKASLPHSHTFRFGGLTWLLGPALPLMWSVGGHFSRGQRDHTADVLQEHKEEREPGDMSVAKSLAKSHRSPCGENKPKTGKMQAKSSKRKHTKPWTAISVANCSTSHCSHACQTFHLLISTLSRCCKKAQDLARLIYPGQLAISMSKASQLRSWKIGSGRRVSLCNVPCTLAHKKVMEVEGLGEVKEQKGSALAPESMRKTLPVSGAGRWRCSLTRLRRAQIRQRPA